MEVEAIHKAKLNNPIPFLAEKETYKQQLGRFFTEEDIEQNPGIPVHINLLEFAIVVIAIMLWEPLQRGLPIQPACVC